MSGFNKTFGWASAGVFFVCLLCGFIPVFATGMAEDLTGPRLVSITAMEKA